MSGKYRAVFDVLTGFFFGASAVKIYYETINTEEANESFIFRRNKKKIDEIRASHENLKVGQSERVIQSDRNLKKVKTHEVFRFGKPQGTDLLYYKSHVLAYDAARKVPLWVAEHLTKEKLTMADNQAERSKSSFQPDPNIPEIFQAKNDDYFKSGWTRGHMAPAGDNKFDQKSMDETFLLSNILPQNYENNANFWYRMEVFCRNLTKQFTDVYVISGPLWLPCQRNGKKIVQYEVIGENNVAVPTHLFKVILAIDSTNGAAMAAFEVPNEPITYEQKLTNFQVPLEKLERDTGFRFFQETRDFKTRNLCDFTGCKLISKETMENILSQRETKNAQNTKTNGVILETA
ncbi:nuclease EXOG, mitochondrial-like [Dendronephthya gigantea]|uniref:nuclease EXOG, mitochondrial-like n=1 Tax=Dendronephthya gigantea TaxID=151771 RepID=UPI00106D579F|nr:nuclease EXOG, mitochondrial-like [Dendronephthya gigantea]